MTWTSFGNGLYAYNSNTDTQITTGITDGSGLVDFFTNNKYLFTSGSWVLISGGGGGVTNLDGLTDVDTTTVTPTNNQVLTYNSAGSKWIPATPPGASGGEANTYSSVGTGLQWTLTKTGVNLPFRSLIAGSNKLSATANTNDITIDVTEANLTLSNIGGTIGNAKISDLAYSKLSSVPSTFTPSAHKDSHKVSGGDAFIKGDDLNASAKYLEDIADPASDAQRLWLEDGGDDIRYWSDEGSPVKHSVASASNTLTFTNKTYDAEGTGNTLTNIKDSNIKAAAAIATSKLADAANFALTNTANSFSTTQTLAGLKLARATKTASTYTLTATDNIILADATSNAITLTLPAASSSDKQIYHIQKIDSSSNTVTIDPNSTEQINGATTLVLSAQYQGVIIWCNGTAWYTFPAVNEKVGKATANGNGSTTVFNIAHGMGATPTYAFPICSSHAIALTYTVDSTNIVVTFASAPSSGTNNVIIFWRAIA